MNWVLECTSLRYLVANGQNVLKCSFYNVAEVVVVFGPHYISDPD